MGVTTYILLSLCTIIAFSTFTKAVSVLPEHQPLCVDDTKGLLWEIIYAGPSDIELSFSPINNAYQKPADIDGTQPMYFFHTKSTYFWAPVSSNTEAHRWTLAGNIQEVQITTLSSCADVITDSCVANVYDYCDSTSFCHGKVCDEQNDMCVLASPPCESNEFTCDEDLRECIQCKTAGDCQAREPIPFCDGGWHCNEETYQCEHLPPPCNSAESRCDMETKSCKLFACSSHSDCSDGNPCNGNELCDLAIHMCYTDPYTPLPCGGDTTRCDANTGKCHECEANNDCKLVVDEEWTVCTPQRACVIDGDSGTLRVCEDRDPKLICPSDKYCDDQKSTCVDCMSDADCYPDAVQLGHRQMEFCEGDFKCSSGICFHYPRCHDEDYPTCFEATRVCSECNNDSDCDSEFFCSAQRSCNVVTGRCEDGNDPCGPVVVTLDNGVTTELPTECNEEERTCTQSVLCLDDSHCAPSSFCAPQQTCNTLTGLCEVRYRDENGTIIQPLPCEGQPCLEDEERCGLPTNVMITYGFIAGSWVLVFAVLAFLCACTGQIS
jgi:hypothetical protein